MEAPCAWSGSVAEFLDYPVTDLLKQLSHHLRETGGPQLFAWRNSLETLRTGLQACLPQASECGLVLEYELPRSGGRRPDLIFLNNGTVLVIEFKNRLTPEASDLDQVLGYVRDLKAYHSACHEKELIPILVPLGFTDPPQITDGVQIVGPNDLTKIIREISKRPRLTPPDIKEWTQASYEPLPALVEAARLLFERQPLPRIRQAEAENIPARVSRVEAIAKAAVAERKRHLVLITGVPGSGKTLIGLQTAYSRNLGAPAALLSGNGPLVQVLQYVLKDSTFVVGLKAFLKDVLVRMKRPPREQVIVFDEAQRAWDRDRVLERHQGDLNDSEPGLLLSLADKIDGGFCVVALLGEGQEIHAGEESGIGNWVDAAGRFNGWQVFGPPHLQEDFVSAGLKYQTENLFNLTASLRSKRASQLSKWTELLLDGQLEEAGEIAGDLVSLGYSLRMSRNLETLKTYIRDRFDGLKEKRTGVIASSKFRKVSDFGITTAPQNFYYYGPWFEEGMEHPKSGSRLETAISEFGCQGLELDLPLLCWGPDLRWEDGFWKIYVGKSRKVKNPIKLRFNAYRVLLTRGRDGLLVFVPPVKDLDSTWSALIKTGIQPL